MKKIGLILMLLTFAVVSCEKSDIRPDYTKKKKPIVVFTDGDRSITDPNNDEDETIINTIVDPNNDEDENNSLGGTGIVDPNNDEDENTDALDNSNEN